MIEKIRCLINIYFDKIYISIFLSFVILFAYVRFIICLTMKIF
jgi:hypothetical protein